LSTADGIALAMTLLVTVGSMGMALVITIVTIAITLLAAVLSMVLPLGIVYLVFSTMAKNAAVERELLATGAAAPARILSIGQTGMYINNQPQVRILLEVAPPDGPVFQATVSKVVSMLQIPRIQPGLMVDVRYDRADPSRLALVGL
jgi:hypothetical protein